MRHPTIAAIAGIGAVAVAGLWSAAPAAADTVETPPGHTVVLWSVQSGVDPNSVPQTYVTSAPGTDLHALDSAMLCGTTYQVDVYVDALEDGTPVSSLWASGELTPYTDGPFLGYDALATPYVVVTTDACAPVVPPKPADEVRHGSWSDEHGAPSCDVDTVLVHREVTTVPYVLVDGAWTPSTDESTWTVTDEESTRPKTAEETASCATTPPPTGEPTTPAPSPVPTTEPTASPSPTAGTPSPAPSSPAPSASPVSTSASTPVLSVPTSSASAVPVAGVTSGGTDELAYTGADRGTLIGGFIGAVALLASGIGLLVRRRILGGTR